MSPCCFGGRSFGHFGNKPYHAVASRLLVTECNLLIEHISHLCAGVRGQKQLDLCPEGLQTVGEDRQTELHATHGVLSPPAEPGETQVRGLGLDVL